MNLTRINTKNNSMYFGRSGMDDAYGGSDANNIIKRIMKKHKGGDTPMTVKAQGLLADIFHCSKNPDSINRFTHVVPLADKLQILYNIEAQGIDLSKYARKNELRHLGWMI